MQIDPWKSFEIKDYDKAIKEFGIEKIDTVLNKLPKKHHYFTRKIIFGHKDLQKVLDAKKNKKPFAMLTGLMPSGKFHLGHKTIADLIVYFQEIGAECYIVVADIESYLTRNISLKEAKKVAIEEYLLNYLALGLSTKNLKFYFQTEGPKDYIKEYMNLSKLASARTTFNEVKAIYGNISPQKLISALTQVADILCPQLEGIKTTLTPIGFDQLPHANFTRDIASRMKFNIPSL